MIYTYLITEDSIVGNPNKWLLSAYLPNTPKTPLSERQCNPNGRLISFARFACEAEAINCREDWKRIERRVCENALTTNPAPWRPHGG